MMLFRMTARSARSIAALGVLAGVLVACGIPAPGKKDLEPRREALRETAEKASQLSVLERQAYTRNTLLQFSAAEQDYRDTLQLARELFPTDPARASSLLLHLALNKSNLGQFDSAEELFDNSRTVVEEFGQVSEAAKPDLFYAQHLMNQQQYAEAQTVAATAVRSLDVLIARLGDGEDDLSEEVKLVERADGDLFLSQQAANRVNARTELRNRFNEDAIAITGRQRLELQRTHASYIIARARRAQGAPSAEVEAIADTIETSLAAIPDVFGRWLRAEAASLRADILLSAGNPVAGLERIDGAIELLRRYEIDSRPEALLLFKKGEFLLEADRGGEARAAYRKALEIIKSDDQGLEFKQAETIIEGLLIEVQASVKGADAELFDVMQKVRSSATAQTVAQLAARLSSGDSTRAQALRQIQNLEREINVLNARLDRLEADPNTDLHVKRVTNSKLSERRKQFSEARAALGENAASYDQLVDATIPLADAQKSLADGEVVAIIQLGEEKGLVAVITNGSFEAFDIDLNVEGAEARVRKLRTAIDSPSLRRFDQVAAHELFETLFGPVKERVAGAEHLIVVPSGPLLSLPFNLLVTEPYEQQIQIVDSAYFDYSKVKWLGAQTGVTTGVSISSFFLGRQVLRGSQGIKPFVGFGDFQQLGDDPESVRRILAERDLPEACGNDVLTLGNLPPLPGTRDELLRVKTVLGLEDEAVILGKAFTDTLVKETDLSQFRVLHFATHGYLPTNPECLPEPGLTTSPSPDGDTLLAASEIVDLNLDADLVVMSACDTGAGAGQAAATTLGFRGAGGSYAAGGESLNGLARGFFFAGARNVLSTHWSVDDLATQQLMSLFYEAVSTDASMTIANAMRVSQVELIEGAELSHPYFWAAFAIIGDGARTLKFDQQSEAAADESEDAPDAPAAAGQETTDGEAIGSQDAPAGRQAGSEAPITDAEDGNAGSQGET